MTSTTVRLCSLLARFPAKKFVSCRTFSTTRPVLADILYTPKHEWISMDEASSVGTIGITNHAQESLGDVVYVELPELGKKFGTGETAGAIESVKAASDLYAPVAGEVVDRNGEVEDKPQLVNKDCYGKGWLYKLKVVNPSELDGLMSEQSYKNFLAEERNKEDETQHF
uniref:Glycine cleavage system H protein n=1 Tax=Globodera rostochiensis TaxID=31243 RepID=A0A914HYP1_GLORO